MSVSRAHLIGTYLAVRSCVSLLALVAVWRFWTEFAAGPWPAVVYLLVVALVPGAELVVLPPLSAASRRTRWVRGR